MEKYEVDYGETSDFKEISILFDYLEEGLDYARENNIPDVLVWSNDDDTKRVVNFDFLKGREFIEKFHWLVRLSRRSNIDGLQYLSNLRDLRWCGLDKIDLSCFPKLEHLNIGYHSTVMGWEALKSLQYLQIAGVRTEDLSFLSGLESLDFLRIIYGYFTSITRT